MFNWFKKKGEKVDRSLNEDWNIGKDIEDEQKVEEPIADQKPQVDYDAQNIFENPDNANDTDGIDKNSPTWKYLNIEINKRIKMYRDSLETPMQDERRTSQLRGMIAELRDLLKIK